ncbi:MAG: hypothetical protein BKP49_03185 [Treponema sp. CETP13]|nr:MAG: hypothetical protein BKP49_03185 [Treponema sp. CETP13]
MRRETAVITIAGIISLAIVLVMCIFGCNINYTNAVIIWTNKPEIATYAELFNASQNKVKAVVVYKENPVNAFPPTEVEQVPDLVISTGLKNEKVRRNFVPCDYLFTNQLINKYIFYPQILNLGNVDNKQYLLPVSFNLPAVVFSTENEDLIQDDYVLSPSQIRDTAAKFNVLKSENQYTKMGFAPSWNTEFIYQMLKLNGANFAESSNIFSWEKQAIEQTVTYLRDWTTTYNSSTTAENDYKFKYLYTPDLDWISSKRCLFAYITSNRLFQVPTQKLNTIDYRWIGKNNEICIDDDIVSMGMYKYSKNLAAAEHFIVWFMNEDNQKKMLQWKEELNLYSKTFGIVDGFSSLQSVNERVYPIFYPNLFGNLPIADTLKTPNILPAKWDSIKERVLIPYMQEAINTDNTETKDTIESLLSLWEKQFF